MALGIVSATDIEMRVQAGECTRTVRPTTPGPHKALQLPEIVQLILAYAVAQPLDPPPLIAGANNMHIRPSDRWMTQWWLPLLVCKSWYLLGQELCLQEISWNHEHDRPPNGVLPPMRKRGLQRFVLHAPDSWFLHETLRAVLNETIDNLVLQLVGDDSPKTADASSSSSGSSSNSSSGTSAAALDEVSRRPSSVTVQPIREEWRRRQNCTLRELSFRGDFSYSGELCRFLNNNTVAQSLTLLELSYAHGHLYFEFDITSLFGSSTDGSVKQTVSPSGDSAQATTTTMTTHLLISRIHLAQVPSEWTPSQPSMLKTLRMSRIKTDNSSLETLLAGLCGPCLEDLEVTMIALPPQEQLTYPTRPYLQNPSTLRRIAETCPRLFAVQLQQTLETRAFDALRGIYNYFPMIQQASLVSSKGHMPEMSGLYQMTRHLTRLFISTKALQASREIHDFLCSDVAEPLEELYLKGALYAVNLIMPRSVSLSSSTAATTTNTATANASSSSNATSGSSSGSDPDQRLWKCRHLQILTVGFESHSPEGYVRDYDADAQSRQIFAFLVTHCPKLRFLDLKYVSNNGSSSNGNNNSNSSSNNGPSAMTPETGLCFLSRLPDLERLVLRTSGFRCRVRSIPSASGLSSSLTSPSTLSLATHSVLPYSALPLPASSSLIPSLTRSRTLSAQDSTRWFLPASDPSTDDHSSSGGGFSSLKLCRRVAKLDGARGHFGRRYGQGILQPVTTKEDHTFGGKGHNRWLSGSQSQQQPHQEIVAGACWRKLSMLMVQYCGFHGDDQVEIEQEVQLFGQLMPSVKVIFAK
ncbi:hypothetical protein DFQ26_006049 [Actinomortierella ambigua]|nr:hypothetical protein DFQ26_006049 [Actinomortierella ambigua]